MYRTQDLENILLQDIQILLQILLDLVEPTILQGSRPYWSWFKEQSKPGFNNV